MNAVLALSTGPLRAGRAPGHGIRGLLTPASLAVLAFAVTTDLHRRGAVVRTPRIAQAATVLDRRREYALQQLAGVPVELFDAVRRREVLTPPVFVSGPLRSSRSRCSCRCSAGRPRPRRKACSRSRPASGRGS